MMTDGYSAAKVSESLSLGVSECLESWIILNYFELFCFFWFVGRCCFVHQAVRIVASVLREGGEVADCWDHCCRSCWHRIRHSKTRLIIEIYWDILRHFETFWRHFKDIFKTLKTVCISFMFLCSHLFLCSSAMQVRCSHWINKKEICTQQNEKFPLSWTEECISSYLWANIIIRSLYYLI